MVELSGLEDTVLQESLSSLFVVLIKYLARADQGRRVYFVSQFERIQSVMAVLGCQLDYLWN